jgi:alpha-galactosidase
MCLHFGAFITESSGHLSEYLPYYRKSEDGRKLLRLSWDGGSRFYASSWPMWRDFADAERRDILSGTKPLPLERSWEYASWIIEAIEKDSPYRIHGNVMNKGLIENLPSDGAVEVACLVDRAGVHATRYGKLPSQMAAICQSNMSFFDLAADACIHRSREQALWALTLDPLSAAVCTPRQLREMGERMFAAQAAHLPGF